MQKFLYLLTFAATSLLLLYLSAACSNHYYAPNINHVPMLDKEGDIRLQGSFNGGDQIEGFDVNAAYALNKNTGIVANGFYTSGPGNDRRNGWLVEAGAGKFYQLGEFGKFECYGGLGQGRVANQFWTDNRPLPLHLTRAFVQPSVGFHSTYFDAAFSLRAFAMYYYPFQMPDTTGLGIYYYFDDMMRIQNKVFTGLEPGITARLGGRYFKLMTQFGVSYHNMPVTTSRIQFGLGAQALLHKDMFKPKKVRLPR